MDLVAYSSETKYRHLNERVRKNGGFWKGVVMCLFMVYYYSLCVEHCR